jgi:hypothetical protein
MKPEIGGKRLSSRCWGTTLDEFLAAEGIRETAKAEALRRVSTWQVTQNVERQECN